MDNEGDMKQVGFCINDLVVRLRDCRRVSTPEKYNDMHVYLTLIDVAGMGVVHLSGRDAILQLAERLQLEIKLWEREDEYEANRQKETRTGGPKVEG
jgi:hypothetical protein